MTRRAIGGIEFLAGRSLGGVGLGSGERHHEIRDIGDFLRLQRGGIAVGRIGSENLHVHDAAIGVRCVADAVLQRGVNLFRLAAP